MTAFCIRGSFKIKGDAKPLQHLSDTHVSQVEICTCSFTFKSQKSSLPKSSQPLLVCDASQCHLSQGSQGPFPLLGTRKVPETDSLSQLPLNGQAVSGGPWPQSPLSEGHHGERASRFGLLQNHIRTASPLSSCCDLCLQGPANSPGGPALQKRPSRPGNA